MRSCNNVVTTPMASNPEQHHVYPPPAQMGPPPVIYARIDHSAKQRNLSMANQAHTTVPLLIPSSTGGVSPSSIMNTSCESSASSGSASRYVSPLLFLTDNEKSLNFFFVSILSGNYREQKSEVVILAEAFKNLIKVKLVMSRPWPGWFSQIRCSKKLTQRRKIRIFDIFVNLNLNVKLKILNWLKLQSSNAILNHGFCYNFRCTRIHNPDFPPVEGRCHSSSADEGFTSGSSPVNGTTSNVPMILSPQSSETTHLVSSSSSSTSSSSSSSSSCPPRSRIPPAMECLARESTVWAAAVWPLPDF